MTAASMTGRPLVDVLLEDMEQLPPGRAAALRVVQIVDDPRSGANDVAKAASADPALTTRMLRMANSAYYGLSGRVGSSSFAVTVLGFQTVRSLAAMGAAGFADAGDLPPGFWERSAAAASGAALVARRVGADVPQAFCVGMLHDLGTALLWRHDPAGHALLMDSAVSGDLLAAEKRAYGGTHATLCADVLSCWQFPEELALAIGRHHDTPSGGASPLRRSLQAGIALAQLADGTASERDPFVAASLEAAQVGTAERAGMVAQVADAAAQLVGALAAV